MSSGTPGKPNSAKPRDSCFTSDGRTPEGNGEARAIGLLLLLLHLGRLNPSRGADAPLARFYSHLFCRFSPGDHSAELDKHFARREGRQRAPAGVRASAGRDELAPRGPPLY